MEIKFYYYDCQLKHCVGLLPRHRITMSWMCIASNDRKHRCRLCTQGCATPHSRPLWWKGYHEYLVLQNRNKSTLPHNSSVKLPDISYLKRRRNSFLTWQMIIFFLKHEIWLPSQSGLALTACIVSDRSFLSHSVWLCDLPWRWIPHTNHALENGDGSSLVPGGRGVELGVSCSEFSINANLAGSQEFWEAFVLCNCTLKSESGNWCSFLSLCGLEIMENILAASLAEGKQPFW